MHKQIVTFVAGGGTGIGRAIAVALGGPDTTVIVAGRTSHTLETTARLVDQQGGRSLVLVMDVTDSVSVVNGTDQLESAVPHIDVLINSAGTIDGGPIAAFPADRWRQIVETNLFGTYTVTRALVPRMAAGGRIVNISSVLGRFGVPDYTAYCAAKHGLIGFTRALALELAPRDITVNAVCPGWVRTDMARDRMQQGADAAGVSLESFQKQAIGRVPIRRFIEPTEVAELVRFLASPMAAAITGQTYNICGGQAMD